RRVTTSAIAEIHRLRLVEVGLRPRAHAATRRDPAHASRGRQAPINDEIACGDHGERWPGEPWESTAFIRIGKHLHVREPNVPRDNHTDRHTAWGRRGHERGNPE